MARRPEDTPNQRTSDWLSGVIDSNEHVDAYAGAPRTYTFGTWEEARLHGGPYFDMYGRFHDHYDPEDEPDQEFLRRRHASLSPWRAVAPTHTEADHESEQGVPMLDPETYDVGMIEDSSSHVSDGALEPEGRENEDGLDFPSSEEQDAFAAACQSSDSDYEPSISPAPRETGGKAGAPPVTTVTTQRSQASERWSPAPPTSPESGSIRSSPSPTEHTNLPPEQDSSIEDGGSPLMVVQSLHRHSTPNRKRLLGCSSDECDSDAAHTKSRRTVRKPPPKRTKSSVEQHDLDISPEETSCSKPLPARGSASMVSGAPEFISESNKRSTSFRLRGQLTSLLDSDSDSSLTDIEPSPPLLQANIHSPATSSHFSGLKQELSGVNITILGGLRMTVEELLTFFPLHHVWAEYANRLYFNGWPASALIRFVYRSRGITSGRPLIRRTVSQRLQDGFALCSPGIAFQEGRYLEFFPNNLPPFTDHTYGKWAKQITWFQVADEELIGDWFLEDCANGVTILPTGQAKGAFTWALELAREHGDVVLLSEVEQYVQRHNLESRVVPSGPNADQESYEENEEALWEYAKKHGVGRDREWRTTLGRQGRRVLGLGLAKSSLVTGYWTPV
ncbi:hypothetical protein M011DRAFT_462558 [Sporormia fimetaria CBS 119925]|uniref:Uncharacterized protein n=1 Tax=Sporormia fimetaria CBS 119925 TaxID=1340428 RepID=A0A6A6UZ01_9PLEO|nr:hypothetical protein M011DRAFT_462558 [Sporormia fimetaria CBS 119925]